MKRDMRREIKREFGVKFWNVLEDLSPEYRVDMIARKNGVSYLVEVKSSKYIITPSKFWVNDKTQKLVVEKTVSKGLNLLKIAVQIKIDVDISYDNPYFVK
jgi:Holliday junction resolvase